MSSATEEDVELRDLVAKVLDSGGVLGKMKAQLRAHVYSALEKGEVPSNSGLVNPNLRKFLDTTTGRLIASLVREFLEFFSLDFTLAVFDPETNLGKDFQYRGRGKLIDALGLTELVDPNIPLLGEIMRLSKVSVLKSESPTPTEVSVDENTSNQPSLVDDPSRSEAMPDISRDYAPCAKVEESSEEGSTSTPQLSLHLNSDIDPRKQKETQSNFVSKQPQATEASRIGESNVSKSVFGDPNNVRMDLSGEPKKPGSLLSDLPPLGNHSALGDLPPLTGSRPRGLAPLKKNPPLSKIDQKESMNKSGEAAGDLTFSMPGDRKGGLVPNLGFDKDHVLSDADSLSVPPDNKKESSEASVVSEDIDEDLDSFLNSSLSAADQFTKEEIVANSDASLRVDHLESL